MKITTATMTAAKEDTRGTPPLKTPTKTPTTTATMTPTMTPTITPKRLPPERKLESPNWSCPIL